MNDDRSAYILLLLSFLPTFFCLHNRDTGKNNLCIKDRTLLIQTVLPDADNVSISCPDLAITEESAGIALYKETELHSTDLQKARVTNTGQKKQKFSVRVTNNTVDYVIDTPQVNDTGLYNCTVEHAGTFRATHTFLLVEGTQSCPHKGGHSVSRLLLVAACGILALYNFITTIVSCSFAWKLRHHKDYVNTRPGVFTSVK